MYSSSFQYGGKIKNKHIKTIHPLLFAKPLT